jgi:hypothetical protein
MSVVSLSLQTVALPFALDGRIDAEKLRELLGAGTEFDELDYKSTLNLAVTRDRLNFVKDCIALSHLPAGGYLVIGVSGDGTPASDAAPIDPKQWDAANLGPQVSRYVTQPVRIASATHDVDGRRIVVVRVYPNPEHLPNPVTRLGQYQDGGGAQQPVLRPGEIWVRRNSANQPVSYADWPSLLANYRQALRQEMRSDAQDLVEQIIQVIRDDRTPDGPFTVPLTPGLTSEIRRDALLDAVDAGRRSRVINYLDNLRSAVSSATSADERSDVLDELAATAIDLARVGNFEYFDLVIEQLGRIYDGQRPVPDVVQITRASDRDIVQLWLEVISRVLAIGAFVTRRRNWEAMRTVASHPIVDRTYGNPYTYGSWIRHASVQGSRAGMLSAEESTVGEGPVLLSRARDLMVRLPDLRPDVDVAVNATIESHKPDALLDSLAQFDAFALLLNRANFSAGDTDYYPHFAGLRPERALPLFHQIVTDPVARAAALPDRTGREVAEALQSAFEGAREESLRYGGSWRSANRDPIIGPFLRNALA